MSTFQCVSTYASSATNTSSIKSCMKSSSRVVDPLHVCDPPGPFKLGVNEEDFSSSVGDEMKMLLRHTAVVPFSVVAWIMINMMMMIASGAESMKK